MRVAFLINDLQLSGGVGVVLQHARLLSQREGFDVTLVLVREQEEISWRGYEQLPDLHVCSREQAMGERYHLAVATWWETAFTLFEMQADRHVYFVQSLEDRFYRSEEAQRLGAGLTLDLPVSFVTEAGWIAQTLASLRSDAACHVVRNGIDKQVFGPLEHVPAHDGPLRVLVEGSPSAWFKHVHDAIHAVGTMREPHHLTVVTADRKALGDVAADEVIGPLSHSEMAHAYERSDVLLKLSSVEGMFGPPLEGFHRGATCVVTPVTGHEEYVVHGHNGLIADWGDLRGTARQLDMLARDRGLLHSLRTEALQTAHAWPSWEQSNELMAKALLEIAGTGAPASTAGVGSLLADLRSSLEIYEGHLHERSELVQQALRIERWLRRIRHSQPVRALLRLRRYRVVRLLARPLRPVTRRLKRLAS